MEFVINFPAWFIYFELICVLTSFCIASFGGIGIIIQARDSYYLKRYVSFCTLVLIWILGSIGYILMAHYFLFNSGV